MSPAYDERDMCCDKESVFKVVILAIRSRDGCEVRINGRREPKDVMCEDHAKSLDLSWMRKTDSPVGPSLGQHGRDEHAGQQQRTLLRHLV